MIKYFRVKFGHKLNKGAFMNKKWAVVLSLIGIFILVFGGLTYFSLENKKETAQNSAFISEKNQDKTSTSKKRSGEKGKGSSPSKASSKQPLSQTDQIEQEVQAFNTSVLSQDYYLEKVENGRLSYEKITEDSLKRLEQESGNKNLGHYQVLHEGKMISVLTGNEEGTDT